MTAQWLQAGGWSQPLTLAASVALALLARRQSARRHACVRRRRDSPLRLLPATIFLSLVALGAMRSPQAFTPPRLPDGPQRVTAVVERPVAYRDGSATLIVRPQFGGDSARDATFGADLLRLRVQHCEKRFLIGDRISFRVTLRPITNFGNPGEFDWAGWNARRGIRAGAFIWSDRDIVSLERAGALDPITALRRRVSATAAARAARAAQANTENGVARGAALVAALTVGDRGGLDRATLDNVRDAGLAHALAISGLHVGLLAAACLLMIRASLIRTAYVRAGHDAVWPACAGAVIAVVGYASLGGAGVSVLRASVMGAAALAVLAFAGVGRPFEVLGVAAAGLALAIPGVATEPGFQLSFAATAALVVLALRVSPGSPGSHASHASHVSPVSRGSRWLGYACVPVLAWLATAALVAQHFQRISLAAPIVNLVTGPLVAAVVLLGLAATALMTISAAAAAPVFSVACWCASQLLSICDAVAAVPWAAIDVVSPGVTLTAALTAFPLLLVARVGRRMRRDVVTAAALAVGFLVVVLVVAAYGERYRDDRLEVHFVSVGQGDATIVKLPGGRILVVDGGRPGRGRLAVGPWLGRLGVRRIDYLVATHAQVDHWGGLVELADRFEVGEFWYNGGVCSNAPFSQFVATLRARGVDIVDVGALLAQPARDRAAAARLLRHFEGGAFVEALGPREADGACDANDRSVVLSIRYAGRGVLLAGDLEAAGEQRLVGVLDHSSEARARAPGPVPVRGRMDESARALSEDLVHDVLKAPHHGSRTSSSQALIDRVEPWLAVAGCGLGNRYGFPHAEVLERYRDAGVLFLSTARHGAVSLAIDADGVRVHTAETL